MQQTFNNGICRAIVIIMPMLSQEVKVENTPTTGNLEQNQDHSIQGIKVCTSTYAGATRFGGGW